MDARRAWVFAWTVLVLGTALFWLAASRASWAGFAAVLLPAGLLCLYGEWRAPYIPGFGTLNFAEGIYFAVALEVGPAPGALAAAAIGLLGDLLRRKPGVIAVFNVGWAFSTFSLVGWTGAALGYRGMGPLASVPAVLGAAAVYFVVASTLQALCMALVQQRALLETLRLQVNLMRYTVVSTVCLGGMCAALQARNPWLLVLLAFPMEILSAFIENDRLHRELVVAQKALVQSEKRAALGVMAAGLAHELNTPLAAVMVNVHLLRDPRATTAERAQCLDVVERAAGRAREIVRGMLACARPGSAEMSADAARAVEDSLVLLRHDLVRDGVAITVHLEEMPLVAIPASDLVQVFTNLVQNARLATRTAERREIAITAEWDLREVRLRVADTGGGIAQEVVERIWDPFFTTRPVGSGTGLGLWMVRSMVEASGGRVAVERTGADGTVFVLSLPRVSGGG